MINSWRLVLLFLSAGDDQVMTSTNWGSGLLLCVYEGDTPMKIYTYANGLPPNHSQIVLYSRRAS